MRINIKEVLIRCGTLAAIRVMDDISAKVKCQIPTNRKLINFHSINYTENMPCGCISSIYLQCAFQMFPYL